MHMAAFVGTETADPVIARLERVRREAQIEEAAAAREVAALRLELERATRRAERAQRALNTARAALRQGRLSQTGPETVRAAEAEARQADADREAAQLRFAEAGRRHGEVQKRISALSEEIAGYQRQADDLVKAARQQESVVAGRRSALATAERECAARLSALQGDVEAAEAVLRDIHGQVAALRG